MSSTVNPAKIVLECQKIGFSKLVQRQFVEMDRCCDGRKVSITCFHPIEPVIVCGFNQVILLSAADWCVPLSEWKQKKIKFEFNSLFQIGSLRWNINGSRLAAGCNEVKEHTDWIETLFWSPFKEHWFTSCHILLDNVMIWNSFCSDTKRPCEIFAKVCVVEWVSTDKLAIRFSNGLIEIRQINEIEPTLTSKIIKQYKSQPKLLVSIWSKESIEPAYSLKTDSECSAIAWRPSVKTPSGVRITVARKALENFTLACGLKDGSILIWNPLEKDKAKMQISLSIAGISQSYKFFEYYTFRPKYNWPKQLDPNIQVPLSKYTRWTHVMDAYGLF
uniref:Uncharacterized protein n=1 Tax=Daphnia galeata TaxID=27404 RepID=A0A8J2RJ45_9CRUS|nr:unnamed protein product [Daphnia galeata]